MICQGREVLVVDDSFGLAPIKREGSVVVYECETDTPNKFPPPWKKEGCYYVLYGVEDWKKKILLQPFNMTR